MLGAVGMEDCRSEPVVARFECVKSTNVVSRCEYGVQPLWKLVEGDMVEAVEIRDMVKGESKANLRIRIMRIDGGPADPTGKLNFGWVCTRSRDGGSVLLKRTRRWAHFQLTADGACGWMYKKRSDCGGPWHKRWFTLHADCASSSAVLSRWDDNIDGQGIGSERGRILLDDVHEVRRSVNPKAKSRFEIELLTTHRVMRLCCDNELELVSTPRIHHDGGHCVACVAQLAHTTL